MPLYDFRCETCGTGVTLRLRASERLNALKHEEHDTNSQCPGYLARVFSAPHVAMVPGTYTRYQDELDRKAVQRAKRRDKEIRRAKEREAKADTLRST